MSAMDHAEAHERIADLMLEPAALDRLDPARGEDRPFLEHVHGCPACSADLAAARALRDGLRLALADQADETAVQPIAPPDWLRTAVLDVARREPRAARGARAANRPTIWRMPRMAAPRWAATIAAGLVIALAGGLAGSQLQRLSGGDGAGSMGAVVATLDRILAASDHRVTQLRTADGSPAGSVAWSSGDFAVLTSSLTMPPGDRVYRCWLEWSGRSAAVGTMEFSGATAYWSGPMGDWAKIVAEPGTRFLVTLEPATAPGERPSGSIVLQASLGT